MFHDLCLMSDRMEAEERRETVALALHLGYSAFAVNHVVEGQMTAADACKIRPLDLGSLAAAFSDASWCHRKGLLKPPLGTPPVRQLTRLTVHTSDVAQAAALNAANPILNSYDIIAVRPESQRAFVQACSSLEVDVVSLPLGQRLPFRVRKPTVDEAIKRGVMFEVTYTEALRDANARRQLFANAQVLWQLTHGRNIILSSGASSPSELRGPHDVSNLSTLFGFDIAAAKAALSHNCTSLILRTEARRRTHRGAIQVERLLLPGSSLPLASATSAPESARSGFHQSRGSSDDSDDAGEADKDQGALASAPFANREGEEGSALAMDVGPFPVSEIGIVAGSVTERSELISHVDTDKVVLERPTESSAKANNGELGLQKVAVVVPAVPEHMGSQEGDRAVEVDHRSSSVAVDASSNGGGTGESAGVGEGMKGMERDGGRAVEEIVAGGGQSRKRSHEEEEEEDDDEEEEAGGWRKKHGETGTTTGPDGGTAAAGPEERKDDDEFIPIAPGGHSGWSSVVKKKKKHKARDGGRGGHFHAGYSRGRKEGRGRGWGWSGGR